MRSRWGRGRRLRHAECVVQCWLPYACTQVELAPLCSADTRPGRPSEAAAVLTEQLSSLLEGAGVVDRRQLCIDPGKAAWAVYVDVYVLDAGGCGHGA